MPEYKHSLVEQDVMVVKSNSLVEARYKLSLGAQRLLATLISSIDRDDRDFQPYQISVKNLAQLFDIDHNVGNIYEQVEKAASELVEKKFSVREGKSWMHTRWLSSAKYIDGQGYVEVRFDPNMKPYLLELKRCFTQYQLAKVVQFRGQYSSRFYEMIKMEEFKSTSDRQFEKTFEVATLREMLELENEYSNFADFRRFVIEPSIKEINKHSDISVLSVDYKKTGRFITSFCVIVATKPQSELPLQSVSLLKTTADVLPSQKQEPIFIIDESDFPLITMGFTEDQIKLWKKEFGTERIQRTLKFVQTKSKTALKDPQGYFVSAIKGDWGVVADQQSEALSEARKSAATKAEQEALNKKQKEEARNEIVEAALSEFYKLGTTDQAALRAEFKPTVVIALQGAWDNGHENNPMFKLRFVKFLLAKNIGPSNGINVLG